jgi:glutamyl-tRNA synthetase
MKVKTRIAPSPTGEYHIGHLRTALYNYALAKKEGGVFLLRIEDTDRNRYIEGSEERIAQVIKDYGLEWDEGPVFQSQRLEIFKEHAEILIEKGHAYYCFCTAERLDKVREEQRAQGMARTRYDKHCLSLSSEEVENKIKEKESFVIRMKIPGGDRVAFQDLIHGEVVFETDELDDIVLLKSDGFPTYHLAVVVDDHLMNVTHVLRGIDWLPSAPIHGLLYKFFGWEKPIFAHLPNIKEKGVNAKLSKRYGAVAAVEFLSQGYLPDAVLNFLMFLGWNPGTEKEIYSMEEFIHDFSMEKVQKTDLIAFDRDKLLWFNGHYIRNMSVEDLWSKLLWWSGKFDTDLGTGEFSDEHILKVLELVRERMKLISEFKALTSYFFNEPEVSRELLTKQTKDPTLTGKILRDFIDLFSKVKEEDWNKDNLDKVSHEFAENKGYRIKEAFMTLRVAVTGETATPPIFDTIELLGKEVVLDRIKRLQQ